MQRLRSLLGAPAGADLSDRHLLECFAASREEAAFEALVRRHAALVLGVCRRVLGHDADAEDAFQATFLVLAQKAGNVGWRESVGGWLYNVAYHIATRSRRAAARRRHHEHRIPSMRTHAETAPDWLELRPILDDELHRLPEKYRLPLLLCYIHGQSREQAAAELGWTAGEVKGRLERGRDLLRDRLVQRGVTLSALALPVVLASEAAAAVPSTLISTTVQGAVHGTASAAALGLMKGALQAMFFTKMKKAGLLAVVAALMIGSGASVLLLGKGTSTARAVPLPAAVEERKPRASEPVEKDGLSVTVIPAKQRFASTEPLAFTVILKNTSDKPFFLLDADYFWDWRIKFGGWQLTPRFEAERIHRATVLEAGQERRVEVKLDDRRSFAFQWSEGSKQKVEPVKVLPLGKYPLVVHPTFANLKQGKGELKHRLWVGELTTKPVEIEVVKEEAGIKASEPVEKDGLSVTVIPAKQRFTVNEPLALTIVLKNVSDKPFLLCNPGLFWDWRIKFGGWEVVPLRDFKRSYATTLLEPGKELRIEVKLDEPARFEFQWRDAFKMPVAPVRALPVGKYPLYVSPTFPNHPQANRIELKHRLWIGELSTKPVEIEVVKEEAGIMWGEPRDGIRMGLSPKILEVKPGDKEIKMSVWYENVGKEDREVTVASPTCGPFRFLATTDGKQQEVIYRPGRALTAAPATIQLKPGATHRDDVTVRFEDQGVFTFVGMPRPEKGQPLTLKVQREFAKDPPQSGPITLNLAGDTPVAWGTAKDGVRVGLSPDTIEVAAEAKSVTVTVSYENVGKEERKLQVFQGGNICPLMFLATKGDQQFYVDFVAVRSATTPPQFVTLKPGESFRETLTIPFEGTPGAGFVRLPRPDAKQPVTLSVGLCTKVDTSGKQSWEAADTRIGGSIKINVKK
jgi:RNA polymerase sigma factor (sigma-70 family)